ncbi:MAG: FHA domain-containing protein, partial [Tepidiformaceae bacterium]
MKFGSLKITTPDGRTREYPLDLPSLVIGRADGNSILIEDLSVARRHARLTIDSGRLLIEDLGSATGTFIGGQRIPANTPSLVESHQDIRLGDVGIVYDAPPDLALATSSATPPVPGALPALEAVSSMELAPTVRAVLSVPPQPIEPGTEPAQLSLTVYNRGHVVDQLAVEVVDIPAEWVHMSTPQLVLLPGHQQDISIAIQVPRTSAARAGIYDFSVVVISGETGRQVVSAGQLNVLPFEEMDLTVHPVRSKRDFVLRANNRGNAIATHTVAASDDEDAFRYEFDAPTLVVAPGDEQTLRFRVRQKHRHMFGIPTAKPFNVVVTPTTGGEKVKAAGQLDVRPPLQPYKRPVVMTAALALVAIGLLAFFFLSSDNTVKTASAEAAYAGVHMCDKGGSSSSSSTNGAKSTLPTPTPAPATSAASGAGGGSAAGGAQIPAGADSSVGGPYFAQNDPKWGADEYAHASDPAFGGNDWCGHTIAQCGCAMTSVTTMLALFNLVVMPDGSPLDPQTVNNWFNLNATQTARGWVSQGYSYGDVIWTAANQLSGEIAKKYPGSKTVKYVGVGTGSDDEIRTQLKLGNPVVLEVPGHFIAAIGVDGDKILINDPYYRDRTTLDAYAGKVKSSRLFAPATDLSAVVITVPADTRVKITDKQGRSVGTLDTTAPADAAKTADAGIPGASYSNQAAWRDPTCVESAPPPGAGTNQIVLPGNKDDYTIQVLDTTGAATSVAIHSYGADGSPALTTIPVASGAATAQMAYDPNSDATKVSVISNTVEAQSDSARAAGQTQTASAPSPSSSPTAAKGTPTPAPTAKPTVQTIVQTALTTNAAAGGTVINVSNQAGFAIGDLIRISPGASNQEDVTISGFGASGFILKSPLKFGHSAGELVIKLGATAPPGPTPTPPPPPAAQLAAPSNVALSCSTVYNGVMPPPPGQPPPTATLICSAAISGTYTTTRWTIDGQVQSQYTGKPVLLAVYNINTTVGVGVAGCNVTLCTSAVAAKAVAFPVNTAAPAATPAPPPPAQGPIGPPPVVNTANIGCQAQPFTGNPAPTATLKCSSSTSMTNFTSVTFKATGTTLSPSVTNVTSANESFQLQVKPTDLTPDSGGIATVPVVVTYCQQETCATSDPYTWVIPYAKVSLTLLPAGGSVQQGGTLSL